MKAILKKIIWILIKKYILFKETRILGIQTFIFFLLTCFRWNIVQTRIRLKLKDEDTHWVKKTLYDEIHPEGNTLIRTTSKYQKGLPFVHACQFIFNFNLLE